MREQTASIFWLIVMGAILSLVAVGLWLAHVGEPLLMVRKANPPAIMGTACGLQAVAPADQMDKAEEALAAATASLRATEVRFMSWRIAGSEIHTLNEADAGQLVALSPETIQLLHAARDLADETDGAFDVTFAPVFGLWAAAGKANRLPTGEQLRRALDVSGWKHFQLQEDAVLKHEGESRVDLGGIAKGYGIDRAVAAMQSVGVLGGLIDVGGDVRCFGVHRDGRPWRVRIQNPFAPDDPRRSLGIVSLQAGAVCTSGNYRRFFEIDGKKYSHIIDPRTGRPTDFAPSVTVVAATATQADAWATALSVLGPEGLRAIDPEAGIEAMIVVGTPKDHRKYATDGFEALLWRKPSAAATTAAAAGP